MATFTVSIPEELKKKLGEKRGENIERFFNQMVGKFEAAIKRLKDLSDRIASKSDFDVSRHERNDMCFPDSNHHVASQSGRDSSFSVGC